MNWPFTTIHWWGLDLERTIQKQPNQGNLFEMYVLKVWEVNPQKCTWIHGKCVEKFDLNHILSPVHSCLRIVTSSPSVLWSEVHLRTWKGTMCLMLEAVVIKITSAPHNSWLEGKHSSQAPRSRPQPYTHLKGNSSSHTSPKKNWA